MLGDWPVSRVRQIVTSESGGYVPVGSGSVSDVRRDFRDIHLDFLRRRGRRTTP
jgi:hypothetical protein